MRIVFATLGLRFDGDSLNRSGLGGSETALICMAREFARLGHETHVFCPIRKAGTYEGVIYQDVDQLKRCSSENPIDVLVCSRFPELMGYGPAAKLKLFWCHDMPDPQRIEAALAQADKFILLSQFQIDEYLKVAPHLAPLIFKSSNGVDMNLVQDNLRPKVPGKIIYTSRPERGLLYLLRDIFPKLLKERPDLKLHICSYDTPGLDTPENIRQVHSLCDQLADRLGTSIVKMGSLPKARLYQEISSSELWLYPTDFPEISCIGAMEAQACGTPVITTKSGALPETAEFDCFDDATDRAIEWIKGGPSPRCRMVPTWPSVAAKWEAMMKEEVLRRACEVVIKKHSLLIAFVSRSLRFDGGTLDIKGLGGSETAIICLARELARRGHTLHVFCLCDRPGDYDGVTYHDLEYLYDFQENNALDCFIAAQFDRILAMAPVNARMKIFWSQGVFWQVGGEKAMKDMLWQCDLLSMVSEFQASKYREVLGSAADIWVCHNGVDPSIIEPNIRPKIPGKLIYTSKYERGLLYLLRDIFPRLLDCTPTLKLHVATYECPGFEVPEDVRKVHAECERLMDGLGDSIVKMGSLTKARLYQEISSSMAMVYPNKFDEAGCITVTESLACGTPVVTSKSSSLPEMCGGSCAALIEDSPGTTDYTENFIYATQLYLARGNDIGYAGMKWVNDRGLTWPNIASLWEAKIIGHLSPRHHAQTIAACMILKNEEADLYRCLRHVRPFVQELHIIVDDSTEDRTEEIARQFSPTTLRRVKFDHFAQMRNESIKDARADWILWIDADEVLLGGQNLAKYLDTKYYDGYVIRQRHLMLDAGETIDPPVRLFKRKPQYRFTGMIHEHAEDTSKGEFDHGIDPVMMIMDVEIAHYGYLNEALRREKVSNRNMQLIQRSAREEPERQLTWALIARDYVNIAQWHLESHQGIIESNSPQHQALCATVDIFLDQFADPKHRYHTITVGYYQIALGMLGKLGLIYFRTGVVPFPVAVGLAVSPLRDISQVKLDGSVYWFTGAKQWREFMERKTQAAIDTMKLEESAPVDQPIDREQLLDQGKATVPHHYAKNGKPLVGAT